MDIESNEITSLVDRSDNPDTTKGTFFDIGDIRWSYDDRYISVLESSGKYGLYYSQDADRIAKVYDVSNEQFVYGTTRAANTDGIVGDFVFIPGKPNFVGSVDSEGSFDEIEIGDDDSEVLYKDALGAYHREGIDGGYMETFSPV